MKQTPDNQYINNKRLTEYKTARKQKNSDYDGAFYFAVITTGIFCRPSCPSPTAKEENVRYFNNPYSAIEQGFRPCLRCKPDLQIEKSRHYLSGSEILDKAIQKIQSGYLNQRSITDLANSLEISERYLRHLFQLHIGLSPKKLGNYHRALFAHKLLIENQLSKHMSITNIAYASGFNSVRQFNDVFRQVFHRSPREVLQGMGKIDKDTSKKENDYIQLKIPYSEGFNFFQSLNFMKSRLLKGIEIIIDDSQPVYYRTFCISNDQNKEMNTGYFSVQDKADDQSLIVKIYSDNIKVCMQISNMIKIMFDTQANEKVIVHHLKQDSLLKSTINQYPLPRIPAAFTLFESIIRAILGQQISIAAATTLASRIVKSANLKAPESYPEGLEYFFPNQDQLQNLNINNLGITKTRIQTINNVCSAIQSNELNLDRNQPFDQFHKNFTAIKGIGEWSAQYVSMRGLALQDHIPVSDLGVLRGLTKLLNKKSINQKELITPKEVKTLSEKWSPYRTYATLYLWLYDANNE